MEYTLLDYRKVPAQAAAQTVPRTVRAAARALCRPRPAGLTRVARRQNDLVRLDIGINGEAVDALSFILHRDNAYSVGKELCSNLKEIIPRQMFKVPIQAKVGEKIIASSQISAMRKDVLAKCYGGDISRKKKLLKKQAAGKKRMKSVGSVDVPQASALASPKPPRFVCPAFRAWCCAPRLPRAYGASGRRRRSWRCST